MVEKSDFTSDSRFIEICIQMTGFWTDLEYYKNKVKDWNRWKAKKNHDFSIEGHASEVISTSPHNEQKNPFICICKSSIQMTNIFPLNFTWCNCFQ